MSVSSTIFHFLLRKLFESYQVYYTILLHNLFFFSFFFFVFLNDYFFRWLAYKSLLLLLSIFSVLINYIMWSYNLFCVSSCFPHHGPGFSGPRFLLSRFFRAQVFQGLSLESGGNFSSYNFLRWRRINVNIKVKFIKYIAIIKLMLKFWSTFEFSV